MSRFGLAGMAQESNGPDSAVFGEFVGAVSEAESGPIGILVGVVSSPINEGSATTRLIRAYVCNGTDAFFHWFEGEAASSDFALESAGGVGLDGVISESGIQGTVILESGARRGFDAAPAAGVEGLYQLAVAENGQAFGASYGGIALSYSPVDGRLEGTFVLPNSEVEALSIPQASAVLAVTAPPSTDLESGQMAANIYRAIVRGEIDGLEIVGAMVDPRPRRCRPVQVTLADGTTQIVTVCKTG
jgi:hypothetical protein